MAEEEKNEKNAVVGAEETSGPAEAVSGGDGNGESGARASASGEQGAQTETRRRSDYRRREGGGQSRGGSDSRQGGSDRGRSRRGYFRKKVCRMCVSRTNTLDYKDIDLLKRFVTDRGKILPRRMTGTCAKHQRVVSEAVKRARMVALLPFVEK